MSVMRAMRIVTGVMKSQRKQTVMPAINALYGSVNLVCFQVMITVLRKIRNMNGCVTNVLNSMQTKRFVI